MDIYIYYVYAYLREDGTPYYIGKGKDNRAYHKQHSINLPKDKSKIIFMERNLSDIGALALERRYICWYGRKDNGTGILRNLTDGGEGASGYKHTKEQCQANSNRQRGRPSPKKGKPSGKKGIKLGPQSTEHIAKLAITRKNRKLSAETKQKMRASAFARSAKQNQQLIQSNSLTYDQ
jgi:hypothetical protein